MPVALVTGVCGQDGAYLARHLLWKGYTVYGARRRSSNPPWRLERLGIAGDVRFVDMDLTDGESVRRALEVGPDEVYNLAAQSFVGSSFAIPRATSEANAIGVLTLLEALRGSGTKLYQASTSEMYGNRPAPQSEATPFAPESPYGVAKLFAHEMCRIYRQAGWVRVSCGILFNHESPLRGSEFVTQKIATALREDRHVLLGNVEARRDWGHAQDYVDAMWRMLQREPGDYVVATGETHTVSQFITAAEILWGRKLSWSVDPALYRPCEVNLLLGDPSKAKGELGWTPSFSFMGLVDDMLTHKSLCG